MTIAHCDMALTTGLNDGTDWTNAYQGSAGLVTAAAALTGGGDTLYIKGTETHTVARSIIGPAGIANSVNPLRVIAVKVGTTNTGGSIVQSDLIPGLRTGNSTRAYLQTTPPFNDTSASAAADTIIGRNLFFYGMLFKGGDNITLGGDPGATRYLSLEECKIEVTGSGDTIVIGGLSNNNAGSYFLSKNCLFEAGAGIFHFQGPVRADFYNCIFNSTDASAAFTSNEFTGIVRFFDCDFSGCSTPTALFNIANWNNGRVELWNCKMPASHILKTGTAVDFYTIINYGSEDSTGLTSGGSEQALEIETHNGTVDIETTVVRTGGATDLAAGLFAYAVVANNVTDNFVGVEIPLRDIWVEGDGTAKTYTAFIANSMASTDLQDDEVYLRLEFPSEAGVSMYDYLPDEGAPGDGGGQTQLLGTPADLTDDTGSTWGSGGNNHQKLSQSIAPDYEGVIHGTLIYSRAAAATLYSDPLPVIT